MMIEKILHRLQHLITIPSFSKEEEHTARFLLSELKDHDIPAEQIGNNVIGKNKYWDETKPVLLLNSHHDTVRPAASYTKDPFEPVIENDKLFGLGSNDAGAALSTLMQIFIDYYTRRDLPFNLLFIASAEEEISGPGGIRKALDRLPPVWGAIVGEPTLMRAAVAERGLMVIDGESVGRSGHAARQEGVNALYLALESIEIIRNLTFDKKSEFLPDSQAVITQIEAGTQHNVIPDRCRFVIDVRINDLYTNREVFEILQNAVSARLTARSFRLNSSFLPKDHPLYHVVERLDLKPFGSATLSDQALMDFPSFKIGPGDSARSHTADEFVYIPEIEEGYRIYHSIIENLINHMS